MEFGGARLTHSLGIQLADRAFSPLLRKGAGVPARVREKFRTAQALHRRDDDAMIRIPVVQGERARADRNRLVGTLEIRPVDVRLDLPAGTEVEVTFEVDASNLVTVVADVPLIQAQFEAEIDLDSIRTPSAESLQMLLSDAERRVDDARMADDNPDVRERLDRLEAEGTLTTAREQVRAASTDAGAAATAEDRLRDLHAELDDVEALAGLPPLVRQLLDMLAEAGELASRSPSARDDQELAALREQAQRAIDDQDIEAVRLQIERTGEFLVRLESRQPGWPIRLFYGLTEQPGLLPPTREADNLVREGKRAISTNDERALESVNQRLIRLIPRDEQSKVIGLIKP